MLGGTSDIGMETALVFAKNNFDIILMGRDDLKLQENKNKIINKTNVNVDVKIIDFLDLDLNDPGLKSRIDESQVTILSIGLMPSHKELENDSNKIVNTFNVNLTSAVVFLEFIKKIYQNKKDRSIIAISSAAGVRGKSSNYIYGSAKSGLITYMSGLRQSLDKYDIHVCTIIPGFVKTKMSKNLDLPKPLTCSPEYVATKIYKAYIKKSNIVYVMGIWRYIMLIINSIPEFIFKKLKI